MFFFHVNIRSSLISNLIHSKSLHNARPMCLPSIHTYMCNRIDALIKRSRISDSHRKHRSKVSYIQRGKMYTKLNPTFFSPKSVLCKHPQLQKSIKWRMKRIRFYRIVSTVVGIQTYCSLLHSYGLNKSI